MTIKSAGQPGGNFKTVLLTVNNGFVFFLIAAMLSFILYIAGNWKNWTEKTLRLLLCIISIASIILFLLSIADFLLNAGLLIIKKETRRVKLIAGFALSTLSAIALAIFSISVIVISEGNLK